MAIPLQTSKNPIFQRFRTEELAARLAKVGVLKIWPQLQSSSQSLNHQPAVSALGRALSNGDHIILVGPAGSGKTILSLQFATSDGLPAVAYLEAQRWAPDTSEPLLVQFLTASGCDVDGALRAFERGKLIVVLDAIDEAPWRARGASISEAVSELSEELDQKAGMLITSRLAAYVPPLASSSITVTLGGVRTEQVEDFLNLYSDSRHGVRALTETLRRLPFNNNVKYSPLILRLLAAGLEENEIPENLAQLFEAIADHHINRECRKVITLGATPAPGSWQECYADPVKHRLLISGLLFNTHDGRKELSEDEFSSAIRELLGPTNLGAHALVDLSALMVEHPLVSVIYSPRDETDYYRVEAGHDWVRTSLLSKFLGDECFTAQYFSLDHWHETLPSPDDFVSAWSYLGDRTRQILQNLEDLAQTPDQQVAACTWLLLQLVSGHMPSDAFEKIYSQAAKLAYKFVPQAGDMIKAINLSSVLTTQLIIKDRRITLDAIDQQGNLSGVMLENVEVIVQEGGPSKLRFVDCLIDGVNFNIHENSQLELSRCYIPNLHISSSGEGRILMNECVYDKKLISLLENVEMNNCVSAEIDESIYIAYALAAVLGKFIHLNESHPETSMRKTNINEENIFTGLVVKYRDIAGTIVSALVNGGYLSKKPTGSVTRYDPTGNFNAFEGAKFIMSPHPEGVGDMTKDILSRIK